jgi:hypothetical protein
VVQLLVAPLVTRRAFGEDRAHGLKKANIVANAEGRVSRHRQGESLGEPGYGIEQPRLAILLRKDVLLRRPQQRQPLLCVAVGPQRPVEAIE